LGKILTLFLGVCLASLILPITISWADSSDIELSYDTGPAVIGVAGAGLPLGYAVQFTPPRGNYYLTKVKFFGFPQFTEPSDFELPFYIQIRDSDFYANTLINLTLKRGDFFSDLTPKWVTVEIPPFQMAEDFRICIYPGEGLCIGFELVDSASNRTYSGIGMNDRYQLGPPMNDINVLIHAIMSPPPPPTPDLNSDGTIDVFDALQLASAFGSHMNEARWNVRADMNIDGIIDIFDALVLCKNFGKLPA
jgi:Dockerin type I domain